MKVITLKICLSLYQYQRFLFYSNIYFNYQIGHFCFTLSAHPHCKKLNFSIQDVTHQRKLRKYPLPTCTRKTIMELRAREREIRDVISFSPSQRQDPFSLNHDPNIHPQTRDKLHLLIQKRVETKQNNTSSWKVVSLHFNPITLRSNYKLMLVTFFSRGLREPLIILKCFAPSFLSGKKMYRTCYRSGAKISTD